MSQDNFYDHLVETYKRAPINDLYQPTITVDDGEARIGIAVNPQHFHGAYHLHGSVIFKLLDDSAFFAAQSVEQTYFIFTANYTSYFIRPVNKGRLTGVGSVISQTRSQIIAKSDVLNDEGKLVASGTGVFAKSEFKLEELAKKWDKDPRLGA